MPNVDRLRPHPVRHVLIVPELGTRATLEVYFTTLETDLRRVGNVNASTVSMGSSKGEQADIVGREITSLHRRGIPVGVVAVGESGEQVITALMQMPRRRIRPGVDADVVRVAFLGSELFPSRRREVSTSEESVASDMKKESEIRNIRGVEMITLLPDDQREEPIDSATVIIPGALHGSIRRRTSDREDTISQLMVSPASLYVADFMRDGPEFLPEDIFK